MEYNLETYRARVAEIEEEAKNKKRLIVREFAIANNTYKRGDIIKDHMGSLIIDKIIVNGGYGNYLPYCSYSGIELKKDGTPLKRQTDRSISQNNIIK